jgi:pyruvate formate lyase activating enzyme
MKECINYKKIDSKKLECRTCSHFCVIKEGETGICGIRENLKGKLYLLAYGKAIAAHIDPIEKKPLFHFLPGSLAYSVGTIGCNFRCENCQNFDISQMFGHKGKVKEYERLNWGYDMSPQEIVEEAIDSGCESIAYTYNEPTIWTEYALDIMKLGHERGLKNVWVSNGFMTKETLDEIIPYLDAINVDVKSFDDNFYKSNCGARVAPVLENCKQLVKSGIWTEITTLVIPTLSDDLAMLSKIAKFIKNELGDFVPWHLSAFSGVISWKLQNLPDTKINILEKAHKIGKDIGLKYVYVGNVFDPKLESTFCPKCGELAIERSGHHVIRYDKCGKCKGGQEIHGIF